MKQVRPGIFETNSSTTHSISIPKTVTLDFENIKKTIGTNIVFGSRSWDEIRSSQKHSFLIVCGSTPFQDRADMLYISLLTLSARDYILYKRKITNLLDSLGFTTEFNEDLITFNDFCDAEDDLEIVVDRVIGGDRILEFLFAPDLALWSWCDECCPDFPKEIEEYLDKLPYDDYLTFTER